MKIVFMGTPTFAVPSLERLAADGHTISAVFTQPDKPKNRGHKLLPPPVKECAAALGLPVHQPASLRDDTPLALLQELNPDLIVVAAYGKLLPKEILSLPPLGCVNVHSSLLPKYRGAAPINWAILNGETETGVSIMYMAEGLDTGDVILQRSTPIGAQEDAQSLTARLAAIGADALSEAVNALAAGTAPRTPQDESQMTYAPLLDKSLSLVNWRKTAHEISCQIRGLQPWPCATTDVISGDHIKLFAAVETGETVTAYPGVIVKAGKEGISIACGDGKVLRITELQAPGSKRMAADAYLRGNPLI